MEKKRKSTDAHIKAVQKYRDAHYKRLVADIKPADFALIDDYARGRGISKAALIVRAVRYCIGHNIDLISEQDGGNVSED